VHARSILLLSFHRRGMDIPRRMLRGALLLIAGLPPAGLASAQSQNAAPAAKCPPAARIDSAKDTYGSTVIADPYRWLEDQDRPETRAWISAEQSCAEASLSKLPGRAQLAARLAQLLHTDSFEAPVSAAAAIFSANGPAARTFSSSTSAAPRTASMSCSSILFPGPQTIPPA